MSARPSDDHKPLDVDSTQTMRAFTATELYDSHRPKSYAIQLVVSDRPVNLDMMPRLEIFAAYRLYTIAAKQADGNWHALRLGFFQDEESAQTVCGYLQTFFSSPSVVRISTAEQERFAQPSAARAPAAKPATAPVVPRQPAMTSPTVTSAPAKAAPTKTNPPQNSAGRRPKTLGEQLMEEARELQRSRSGRSRAPEQSGSWLSRLFGGAKPRPRSI